MNYRHSFHAGNSADVVKHALLIALVRALQLKEGPLTLIDTHAGCGLYDLQGDDAARTGEAASGIGRIWNDPNQQLAAYLKIVKAVNGNTDLQLYPGSPLILANLLRPQDGLAVNELHPEDVAQLRRALRGTVANIHQRDAYEFWLASLPPTTPRGLVVIDPPYEQPNERQRITEILAAANCKFAHGVTCIWYPLKDRVMQWQWEEQLRALGLPKLLRVEHVLYDDEIPDRYNGAGLYIVNPPFAFTKALPDLMEALRAALAPPGHRGKILIEWL